MQPANIQNSPILQCTKGDTTMDASAEGRTLSYPRLVAIALLLILTTWGRGSLVRAGGERSHDPYDYVVPESQPMEGNRVPPGFTPIDMSSTAVQAPSVLPRGKKRIAAGLRWIGEVPFRVSDPADIPGVGRETVGAASVSLPGDSREIFMLIRADIPGRMYTHQSRNSTMYLWRLAEPEFFVVEVTYEDGTADRFIPFNPGLSDYALRPGIQTCVVHPDPKKTTEKLVFRDRMRNTAFGLVGVTVNAGEPRVEPPRKLTPLPPSAPSADRVADCRLEFGTEDGLAWEAIHTNLLDEPVELSGVPVFSLRIGERDYPSTNWHVAGTERTGNAQTIRLELQEDDLALRATLRSVRTGSDRVELSLEVLNEGEGPVTGELTFPRLAGLTLGSEQDTWYLFTANGGIINNIPADWTHEDNWGPRERWEFGDKKPLQVDGFFNPVQGGGVSIRTRDRRLLQRTYTLTKQPGEGCSYGIRYFSETVLPGESWSSTPVSFQAVPGGWRQQFNAYRSWAKTVDNRTIPAPKRFRETFLTCNPPIWTTNFREDVIEAQEKLYGVGYVHLFGWSFHPNTGPNARRAGRPKADWGWRKWGVYDRLDKYGGIEGFKTKIMGRIRQEYGAGVGLYVDPYLYDRDWDRALEEFYGNLPAEEQDRILEEYNEGFSADAQEMTQQRLLRLWVARQKNGRPRSGHHARAMCLHQEGWRAYVAGSIQFVAERLHPTGIYVDEVTRLLGSKKCFAPQHDHRPGDLLSGIRTMLREIREVVPPDIALYCEYTPVDVMAPLMDGSLGHVVTVGWHKTPTMVRSFYEKAAPHYVDLPRFALPRLKRFEIFSHRYLRNGNWFVLKYPFFNGSAFYGRGFVAKRPGWEPEPAAVDFVRNALRILRTHADAFTSEEVEPLVETRIPLVFANRFSTGEKTVWTLFNAGYRTRRGVVLEVRDGTGARYADAWNDTPIEPEIDGQTARIPYEIGPRSVGCIIREPAQ